VTLAKERANVTRTLLDAPDKAADTIPKIELSLFQIDTSQLVMKILVPPLKLALAKPRP
jgi:hypothetical protein